MTATLRFRGRRERRASRGCQGSVGLRSSQHALSRHCHCMFSPPGCGGHVAWLRGVLHAGCTVGHSRVCPRWEKSRQASEDPQSGLTEPLPGRTHPPASAVTKTCPSRAAPWNHGFIGEGHRPYKHTQLRHLPKSLAAGGECVSFISPFQEGVNRPSQTSLFLRFFFNLGKSVWAPWLDGHEKQCL